MKNLIREELYTEPIRDPLWKHIYLTEGMKKLIQHPSYQSLNRIKQLGPSYLVYPGATHSRFNHSIGVFHTAKRIISTMMYRSEIDFLEIEEVNAFLAASLLHDLGHFPYTHSLKELALKEHEELTAELLLEPSMATILREDMECDPELVAAIVDENRQGFSSKALVFFRGMLSGVLDPDKLDYLNRDAYFCGVPYGSQDTDFIISKMHAIPSRGTGIELSGIPAVEHLLFGKYLMYRSVYWHRSVRAATAMIKKSLFDGIANEYFSGVDLYHLDDDSFYTKFAGRDKTGLINMVYTRNFYQMILDLPVNGNDRFFTKYSDLNSRLELEKIIAAKISEKLGRKIPDHFIILDIPEKISFEIDIPILGKEDHFEFSDELSVFSREIVQGFTKNIRIARVFCHPEVIEAGIKSTYILDLVNEIQEGGN
jgi:HD superfamily phosphohydrolase